MVRSPDKPKLQKPKTPSFPEEVSFSASHHLTVFHRHNSQVPDLRSKNERFHDVTPGFYSS